MEEISTGDAALGLAQDDRGGREAGAGRRGQAAVRSKDFADETTTAEEKAKADPAAQFELLDVAQIKGLPDPVWLIDGVVNEQSLGFIYGPPGLSEDVHCARHCAVDRDRPAELVGARSSSAVVR